VWQDKGFSAAGQEDAVEFITEGIDVMEGDLEKVRTGAALSPNTSCSPRR
jgi:hypothetical protein